jgi:hypothetical protein
MLAFIQFDPALGWWTKAVFWYVVVNIILCLGFTVVVIIGGIGDLRFLLKSMDQEQVDESDDGRVRDGDAS